MHVKISMWLKSKCGQNKSKKRVANFLSLNTKTSNVIDMYTCDMAMSLECDRYNEFNAKYPESRDFWLIVCVYAWDAWNKKKCAHKKEKGHLETLKGFLRDRKICVCVYIYFLNDKMNVYRFLTVAFVISLFEIFHNDSINYLLIWDNKSSFIIFII